TLVFEQQASINVVFDNGSTGINYGELVLANASAFSGQIIGFGGTAPDAAHSDAIDVCGMDYGSCTFSQVHNGSTDLLTVSDGSTIANLTFDNFNGALSFAADGHGGTLVTDPPASAPATAEAVISAPDVASSDPYTVSITPEGSNYVGSVSVAQDGAAFDFKF